MRFAVAGLETTDQVEPRIGIPAAGQQVEAAAEIQRSPCRLELDVAVPAELRPAVDQVVVKRGIELDSRGNGKLHLHGQCPVLHLGVVAAVKAKMRPLCTRGTGASGERDQARGR